MKDTNFLTISGRVSRALTEKDYSVFGGGMAKLSFSITSNRAAKDGQGGYKDTPEFFDVVAFGQLAEELRPAIREGQPLRIDGKIRQDRWQDKQTGAPRSKVYICADTVLLAQDASAPQEEADGAEDDGWGY